MKVTGKLQVTGITLEVLSVKDNKVDLRLSADQEHTFKSLHGGDTVALTLNLKLDE